MSRCQISLPFSSINRLADTQKYKLLSVQCQRLEIEPWETTALIDICRRKGYINKGLGIVYKYAGCVDEIRETLSKLSHSIEQLCELERNQHHDSNSLLEEILLTALLVIRLYFTISNWRKLQWTPRPISIEENGAIVSFSEFVAQKLNCIALVMMALSKKHLKILRKIPAELLSLLFSPIQMYEGINELCTILMNGGTSLSSTLPGSGHNNTQNLTTIVSNMAINLMNMEDIVDEKWKDVSSREEQFATLCIPYKESKATASHLKWFLSTLPVYEANIHTLASLISTLLGTCTRIKASDLLVETLATAIDEKKQCSEWTTFSQNVLNSPQSLTLISMNPIVLKSHVASRLCLDKLHSEDAMDQPISPPRSILKRDSVRSDGLYVTPEAPANRTSFAFIQQHRTPQSAPEVISDDDTISPVRTMSSAYHMTPMPMSTPSMSSVGNSISPNAQSADSSSWRRKRMISDPVRGVKRLPTQGIPRTYSEDGGRARTWSVRNKLRGIDFSNTSLAAALAIINDLDESLEENAARKIQIWFMLVGPRRRLLQRLYTRDCVMDIINLLLEKTNQVVSIRQRRRRHLLRQGAAMKIQRCFRHWVKTVLEEERKVDFIERQKIAQKNIDYWVRSIMNGIRLYRYVRYCIRKKLIKKTGRQRQALNMQRTIMMYFQLISLTKRLQIQHELQQRMLTEKSQAGSTRRVQMFRAIDRAVSLIQKLIRRYMARKRQAAVRKYSEMYQKVTMFILKCLARRRRNREKRNNDSARRLQAIVRGFVQRKQLYKVVRAGLKLNMLWRKFTAYRSLKGQLRRVERPYTIIVHGLRNIPKRLFITGTVKFKVYVWWNPLLHIVGKSDFLAFLQSKQPQYIYTSAPHKLISEEVDDNKPTEESQAFDLRTSFSLEALSKLGTSFLHGVGGDDRKKSVSVDSSHGSPGKSFPNIGSSRRLSPDSSGRSKSTLTALHEADEDTGLPSSGSHKSSPAPSARPSSAPSSAKNSIFPSPIPHPDKTKTRNDSGRPAREFKLPSQLTKRAFGKRIAEENEDDDEEVEPYREDDDEEDDDEDDEEDEEEEEEEGGDHEDGNKDADATTTNNNNSHDTTGEASQPVRQSRMNVMRQTFNFAMKLGSNINNSKKKEKSTRILCNFEDETIKIPGCHGNGVFKFEILDGDRRVGYVHFFLSKEGELMYWGGEYQREVTVLQQKRAVQLNSQVIRNDRVGRVLQDKPVLDFRVVSGAPLRSKCQWGRLVVRGKGPFKRALQNRNIMNSLTIFDNWQRFFLSLDEFGLFFFENKFDNQAFFTIPVKDLKFVTVDAGAPIRNHGSNKNIIEDINNVILKTYSGDELFIRFPDSVSRIAWFEVLRNAIDYHHQSTTGRTTVGNNKSWLLSSFFDKKPTLQRLPSMGNINTSNSTPSDANRSNPNLSPLKSKYMSAPHVKPAVTPSLLSNLHSPATHNNSGKKLPETGMAKTTVPPAPKTSPLTLNHKSRKPPIFSVPFKGKESESP